MKKVLLTLITIFLVACNPIDTVKEMGEKQEAFSKESMSRLGVKAVVGWNIHNGTLTNVNVVYPANELGEMKISELERITTEMVLRVFKEKPKAITFSISITDYELPKPTVKEDTSIIRGQ